MVTPSTAFSGQDAMPEDAADHPPESGMSSALSEPAPLLSPFPIPHLLKVADITHGRSAEIDLSGVYGSFEDIPVEGILQCDWRIHRKTAGFQVQGAVSGSVLLECARCLTSYALPIALAIDEHYVLQHYVEISEREKELFAEDYYETIGETGTLDLSDLLHQFLVIEAENNPLCGRSDCHF